MGGGGNTSKAASTRSGSGGDGGFLCSFAGLKNFFRGGLLLNELFALQGEAEGGGGGILAGFALETSCETAIKLLTVDVGKGGGVGLRVLGAEN